MIFETLFNKAELWLESETLEDHKPLSINGISAEQWAYILAKYSQTSESSFFKNRKTWVITAPNQSSAETFFDYARSYFSDHFSVFFYTSNDHSPYSGIIASENILFNQFKTLESLCLDRDKQRLIVTTFDAALMRVPPAKFFQKNHFELEVSDIVSPHELATKLLDLGYSAVTTVEEPGSFSHKGEIFDIFTTSASLKAIRIHYFDDMIEEIFNIDLSNQKTNRSLPYEKIKIGPSPRIFAQQNFKSILRDNIPMPLTQQKERFYLRNQIFERLNKGMLFDNYPYYLPLFFQESATLYDYLSSNDSLTMHLDGMESINQIEILKDQLWNDYNASLADDQSFNLLPSPNKLIDFNPIDLIQNSKSLIINEVSIYTDLNQSFHNSIDISLESALSYLRSNINPTLPKNEFIREALSFLATQFKNRGKVIFTSPHQSSHEELKNLLDLLEIDLEFTKNLFFEKSFLPSGFYYKNESTLILTDHELFAYKHKQIKSAVKTKDLDLFAEQISTLKVNDYVIHTDHGVGVYKGLESLDIGPTPSDYLVIEYTGHDKIYVPVYKMNLIQKHADESAKLSPDSLRTNKFAKAKTRAKESVKKLAFDLLKLQAQRQSSQAFSFSPPDEHYYEFENSFPFRETKDQKSAINNIIHSMQKPIPMDHLVCGDVGFGKTEIAMRAAYKAVLDGKQVCILVPTTILALQHFHSFKKRFSGFAVKIDFISRFKSPKESSEILESLKQGNLDIIIGTHKLLSDKIKFHDLGLVIVDEEQRFGVGHKEKLKLLKSSVDFLTLTATPIPRTLQLAFLGLRELSLIKTPPPRRQSIKSYLIREDDQTIKMAIQNEINRGGQVFIVHNKVQDMQIYETYIRNLVPSASVISAHGQMSEKELEKRMNLFYSGKYQVLIATTIIESGLDIPNANTMIIDRSDRYGLAQLHQLRGRIGRSDKKAYCYFVIPRDRTLSGIAEKRLKALQTYADVGSGFNIANCDLEIRGAGDILGAHQSGHVEAVGLELYMELLKEAIFQLRGEKTLLKNDIEVNTPFAAYIPNNFIQDSSERLRLYKKLSNSEDHEQIVSLKEELIDRFGALPKEVDNLIKVLQVRINLQRCGLKQVQVGGKIISLSFDKKFLEAYPDFRNKIVETFIKEPKTYQFTPDFKVVYTHKNEVTPSELVDFSYNIAQKILPC